MSTTTTRSAGILLAEDSPTQALQERHALEEAGYRVTRAADGALALAAARSAPPDLIVSDVLMPGLNGYDLCAACRADAALRNIPFILLTDLDGSLDVLRGLQAGADRYLAKPVSSDRLLAAVRELLAAPARPPAERDEPALDITLDGQTLRITASREQIAAMLLSTYDAAVRTNHELLRAQDEIRRQREDLEDMVGERTLELSRVNASLREAVSRLEAHEHMRSEFIGNVFHELRTPVATMIFGVNNLLKGMLGPPPERFRPYLLLFAQECERLKGTVADILDLERIDAKTLILHPMKLPFQAWVARAAGNLRAKAVEKKVTLSLAEETPTGFVNADPVKLERVIVSVVRNAVHYTPEGGHVDIEVHFVRAGAWLELSVTDDGVGVAPEHLPQLTDRYFRVGEFVSGTGLGLALCKEILERMGGEIELLSPPPGRASGTQVLIRLPSVSAPVILAVDDSKTVLGVLELHLRAQGYSVVGCGNGELALDILSASPPDLLIVDAVLPRMNGTELVTRVKANHALRHLPILMVTGAEIAGEMRKTLEDFRIPVLGKPWEERELIACVEDTIYGKHYLER